MTPRRHDGRRGRVAIGARSVAVLATLALPVAAAAQGEGSFDGQILVGYRSVSVDGSENKYREDLGFDDGPMLLDLDIRLVPEGDSLFTHTLEGPDDMPSHIKSALTATQLSIPFQGRKLMLGTWQGIYLWEHRSRAHTRQVIVSVI